MLCLQNGRFDDPDRSFISVKGAWDSVLNNHADLKVSHYARPCALGSGLHASTVVFFVLQIIVLL